MSETKAGKQMKQPRLQRCGCFFGFSRRRLQVHIADCALARDAFLVRIALLLDDLDSVDPHVLRHGTRRRRCPLKTSRLDVSRPPDNPASEITGGTLPCPTLQKAIGAHIALLLDDLHIVDHRAEWPLVA